MAAKKFRKSKFSCPVGGFVGERCLKHRASSMNDAHVRKSHAIDRFHAWVDRSRSHGFMRPCLDFHYRMGLRVDVYCIEKSVLGHQVRLVSDDPVFWQARCRMIEE